MDILLGVLSICFILGCISFPIAIISNKNMVDDGKNYHLDETGIMWVEDED